MRYLAVILLFVAQQLPAQNLTGKWTGEQVGPESTDVLYTRNRFGEIVRETITTLERYKLEIKLVQEGNLLSGTAKYRDYNTRHWVETRIAGTIEGNKVTLVEEEVTGESGRTNFYYGTIKGDLYIDSAKKKMIIQGMIFHQRLYDHKTHTATNQNSDAGGIKITRSFSFDEPVAVVTPKKPDPEPIPALPPVNRLPVEEWAQRKKLVEHIFETTTDSLRLEFYDDSDIDDDTITVYYNNRMILSKQRLTARPLQVSIFVPPGTDNELLMFANNVGSIPPNTALLVFYDNGIRKEIRIDSDTQKSGTVVFRRKE